MAKKSCSLKHIVAMQRIRDRQQDVAPIFEDDAQLIPNFGEQLQRVLKEAKNWPRPPILHLGAATNFYTPDQLIYLGDRLRNAEANVLGATEAEARLDWIANQLMDLPIDFVFNNSDPALGTVARAAVG